MTSDQVWIARRGDPKPPEEPVLLVAGALTCRLHGVDLRDVRWRGHLVVAGVYVAVRDQDWGTVPAALSGLLVRQCHDGFEVSFEARHQAGEVDFRWHGVLRGLRDGTLYYTMDGEVLSSFHRNRIGFCVLHSANLAGAACEVEHTDGRTERGAFPKLISPRQPFVGIRGIRHRPAAGLRAEVRLEGETYEMEDQRNWTDASYKTYCTPLSGPYPVLVAAGLKVRQAVTIRLTEARGAASVVESLNEPSVTTVLVSPDDYGPMPPVGVGRSSTSEALGEAELALLQEAGLSHLRCDVPLGDADWQEDLVRACGQAAELGLGLEMAVRVPQEWQGRLRALLGCVAASRAQIARWILLSDGGRACPDGTAREVASQIRAVGHAAPIGGGCDTDFVDVNRGRPSLGSLDFLAYPLCPQVHAFDDESVMETVVGQAATLRTARALYPHHPVALTPITLCRRWNPDATGPRAALATGALPPEVDPRQMSLFAGAWTVASLGSVLPMCPKSLTYFETTGWRGLVEGPGGSLDPAHFHSEPGAAFPVYHVLKALCELRNASVGRADVTPVGRAAAVLLRGGGRTRLVLANVTPRTLELAVEGAEGAAKMIVIDEDSFRAAAREPNAFRARAYPVPLSNGGMIQFQMKPYAIAWLDFAPKERVQAPGTDTRGGQG